MTRISFAAIGAIAVLSVAAIFANLRNGIVSADELGNEWPLTVPAGHLQCAGVVIVFRDENGKLYGLRHMDEAAGYSSIASIRRHDPKHPELFVSMAPLIKAAESNCGELQRPSQ